MKYLRSEIISHGKISDNIFKMVMRTPEIAEAAKPGQFINVYLGKGEMILPRPISICGSDKSNGYITVIYRVAGKGTAYLSSLPSGGCINIAGPLGCGFDIEACNGNLAVIAGGIGSPPMLFAAKAFKEKYPQRGIAVFLGFRDKSCVILEDEFKSIGITPNISTEDGSYGYKGNALGLYKESGFNADTLWACGPYPMLKAVASHAESSNLTCCVSMEERMGCGIGACVGCAVHIKDNSKEGFTYKKVCKDGPVFESGAILWQ